MPELSEQDWQQIKQARKLGVLIDLDPDILRGLNQVILVGCGDLNRDPEACEHLRRLMSAEPERAELPRIHSLKQNGGALVLPESTPVRSPRSTRDIDLIQDIGDAHTRLGVSHLLLKAHLPCLKAEDNRLDFQGVATLLVKAKHRIKRYFPRLSVIKLLDVDLRRFGEKQKTFKVSRRRLQSCGMEISALEMLRRAHPERAFSVPPMHLQI